MEIKQETKEPKEFREERFEFALYVNNNLICKRNFKINNYINNSMHTLEFKETCDYIVNWMIDADLKSKSRVYTWYYYDENYVDPEFTEPLIPEGECVFKFVVSDNKKPVYTAIWDGAGYPKSIREKVDIANKTVKITNKDGRTYSYDKEVFFETNKDRLTPELYVLRAQILDKPDLLIGITKRICETCSPREDLFQRPSDYTTKLEFSNQDFLRKKDGSLEVDENGNPIMGPKKRGKSYYTTMEAINRKVVNGWDKATEQKTKAYFSTLRK